MVRAPPRVSRAAVAADAVSILKDEIKRDFGFTPDFESAKHTLEKGDGAGNTFKATAKPVLIGTAVVGATTMGFGIIMLLQGLYEAQVASGMAGPFKEVVAALSIVQPEIILGQLVKLERGGELVRISKRAGNVITLADILDAFRELMLPQTTLLVGNHNTLWRWLLPDWANSKSPGPRDLARAASEKGVALTSVKLLAPLLWGAAMAWTLADDKILRATAVLVGVVALSLVVGGIVIMNIMLMVVSERTREIGVSKALGARSSTIKRQFLTESVMISLMGGGVGVIMGMLVGNIVGLFFKTGFVVPWMWIMMGVSVCGIVGIISGIYPAIKASKLDPIVALRYE
mgnify:CR=1 FL=1